MSAVPETLRAWCDGRLGAERALCILGRRTDRVLCHGLWEVPQLDVEPALEAVRYAKLSSAARRAFARILALLPAGASAKLVNTTAHRFGATAHVYTRSHLLFALYVQGVDKENTALVLRSLDHRAAGVRANAVLAARWLPVMPVSYRRLALEDADEDIRGNVAQALGEAEWDAALRVELLRPMLRDASAVVRTTALIELAELLPLEEAAALIARMHRRGAITRWGRDDCELVLSCRGQERARGR